MIKFILGFFIGEIVSAIVILFVMGANSNDEEE